MSKVHVLGVSLHQGEFEGRPYDFMKFTLRIPFPPDDNKRVGYGVVERKAPSSWFSKWQFLKYPFDATLVTDEVAKGGGRTETIVISAEPPVMTATGRVASV